MKKAQNELEFLKDLNELKDKNFQAGLTGEACAAMPMLTEDTTAEEETQMIYESIENIRTELKHEVYKPDLMEVLVLLNEIIAKSYRDGIAARSLLKESSPEKESA